jgi:hypothetical protein
VLLSTLGEAVAAALLLPSAAGTTEVASAAVEIVEGDNSATEAVVLGSCWRSHHRSSGRPVSLPGPGTCSAESTVLESQSPCSPPTIRMRR